MIYWSEEIIKMRNKSLFGQWLYRQLDTYQISMLNLSDYSGIHVRTLYRMANGTVGMRLEDLQWLVECISDMTNQEYNDVLLDCVSKTLLK